MSATNSLHYQLCKKAASFLMRNQEYNPEGAFEKYHGMWKIATVEMVTQGTEDADVWATNGYESVVVEVKTSRADFFADQKKWHRAKEYEYFQSGNFRYYLSPSDVIRVEDLPSGWGLLHWDGRRIVKVKQAPFRKVSNRADLIMMSSILRRLGVEKKIFNFREEKYEDGVLLQDGR